MLSCPAVYCNVQGPGSAGEMSATTGRIFHGRQIDHRILIEEPRRHQLESADDTGLHRMIFLPRQMMQPEAVPDDDIGILDGRSLRGPGRQTILALWTGSRTRRPGNVPRHRTA